MEIKKLDKKGLDFLAQEEGLKLKPYLDSKGIPTIGVGCTYYPEKTNNPLLKGLPLGKKVSMKDKPLASKDVAYALYYEVSGTYETAVWSLTRDDITQNQFNALVCLTYNIGVAGFKDSTVLRLVNQNPSDKNIEAAFEMWHRAGENEWELLPRRKREHKLYFTP